MVRHALGAGGSALRRNSDVPILRATKNTRGSDMIIYARESTDQPIADQEIP